MFLLLAATYCVKPARDGLLATSGAPGFSDLELKAYTSFGQTLLLFLLLPVYARLAEAKPRRTLVTQVTLFFVGTLLVFWLVARGRPGEWLGVSFYLWTGIFNVFVVAQFWVFVADLYSDEDGRRLLPVVGIGAAAGATLGSWLVRELLGRGWMGTDSLLPLSAVLVFAALVLMRDADVELAPRAPSGRRMPGSASIRFVLRSRYLLAAAVVVLLLNWVKTNGDNLLFAVVQEVLEDEVRFHGIEEAAAVDRFVRDRTTAFYGDLFFWVSLFSLLVQSLVTSRLLRFGGFGWLLLSLPVFAMVSYSALALVPVLWFFRWTKIAEDSASYSLHNTALQVLWLPTTREMKYRGKTTIDTVFVRLGDGFAALTAFGGIHLLALSIPAFFALNGVLASVWIVIAVVLVREHRRRVRVMRSRKMRRLSPPVA